MPMSVRTFSDSPWSITVHWAMVQCIHHNGDITGYLVRYTAAEGWSTLTAESNGTLISNLRSSTHYSIQVAAVNSAGTGPYSNAVDQLTEGVYI